MRKWKVGVVGAAGYTGGELLRILVHHSHIDITTAFSRSQAGKNISSVHRDLLDEIDLPFTDFLDTSADVVFLCLPHGEAAAFLQSHRLSASTKIIDLSQDFRLQQQGFDREFIYGLPELNREAIKKAASVSNPGCFATAILLSLLPLAKSCAVEEAVHVSGTTGSTGAGVGRNETSHFTWRQNNFSAYKRFSHQHMKEIYTVLKEVSPQAPMKINFLPHRGPFTRGIHTVSYMKSPLDVKTLFEAFAAYYDGHPFVSISEQEIDVKQCVNTNKAFIHLDRQDGQVLVTTVLDNLLKGASGQAVQNMNLMLGLDEREGLRLKGSAY